MGDCRFYVDPVSGVGRRSRKGGERQGDTDREKWGKGKGGGGGGRSGRQGVIVSAVKFKFERAKEEPGLSPCESTKRNLNDMKGDKAGESQRITEHSLNLFI